MGVVSSKSKVRDHSVPLSQAVNRRRKSCGDAYARKAGLMLWGRSCVSQPASQHHTIRQVCFVRTANVPLQTRRPVSPPTGGAHSGRHASKLVTPIICGHRLRRCILEAHHASLYSWLPSGLRAIVCKLGRVGNAGWWKQSMATMKMTIRRPRACCSSQTMTLDRSWRPSARGVLFDLKMALLDFRDPIDWMPPMDRRVPAAQ